LNIDEVKGLYLEYLNTPYSHPYFICESCGYFYSHPLNYCVKCPSKTIRRKPRVIELVKSSLKQMSMISPYLGKNEFGKYYEEKTGNALPESFSYSNRNYYELMNTLYPLIGKKQFPIDDYFNADGTRKEINY
jgi:hypothetical protein